MKYYSNPITGKEKISNALLSFDEAEFDALMAEIHKQWYVAGWDAKAKQKEFIASIDLPITF